MKLRSPYLFNRYETIWSASSKIAAYNHMLSSLQRRDTLIENLPCCASISSTLFYAFLLYELIIHPANGIINN